MFGSKLINKRSVWTFLWLDLVLLRTLASFRVSDYYFLLICFRNAISPAIQIGTDPAKHFQWRQSCFLFGILYSFSAESFDSSLILKWLKLITKYGLKKSRYPTKSAGRFDELGLLTGTLALLFASSFTSLFDSYSLKISLTRVISKDAVGTSWGILYAILGHKYHQTHHNQAGSYQANKHKICNKKGICSRASVSVCN